MMHAARGALLRPPRLLMHLPRGYASSLLARARAGSSPTRGVRAAALSTAPPSPPPPPLRYSDDYLRGVLGSVETIAVVGASADWKRPSYFAMKYGAKVLWLQLGVRHDRAAAAAEAAGLRVVQDRCPKIEFARLYRELGWHGFNSGVISSRRVERGGGAADGGAGAAADGFASADAGFETRAVHAGARVDPTTGARVTPIYQNTSFVFDDADHAASLFNLQTFGNIYGRLSNPTTAVLEERVAALEGGRGGTCTASGHAAQVVALFALMRENGCVVSEAKAYMGTLGFDHAKFQEAGKDNKYRQGDITFAKSAEALDHWVRNGERLKGESKPKVTPSDEWGHGT